MAESDSGVDPGDEEALAAPAGEALDGIVGADIVPEAEPPGERGLLLGEGEVGVGEPDSGLGEEFHKVGGPLLGDGARLHDWDCGDKAINRIPLGLAL